MGCYGAACILSVTQNPPVSVAISGQISSVDCSVTTSIKSLEEVISTYIESEGATLDMVSHPAPGNLTHRHSFTVRGPSAMYYCKAQCGPKILIGRGTYIHARDSGFVDPLGASDSLRSGLIALLVLLLLLAGSGTLLVLYPWILNIQKGPVISPPIAAPNPRLDTTKERDEKSGSLYESLEPHSDEVYDVLENDRPKPQDQRSQAQVHDVINQSPLTNPTPRIKPNSDTLEPPGGAGKPLRMDKPPLKKVKGSKPQSGAGNYIVYENVKR
ncbi:NFAT activation molecule 1 [Pelodytes ibericus]